MKSSLLTLLLMLCVVLAGAVSAFASVRWLQPLPHGNGLKDVVFLDESTAIAVGDDGTAMVSHDAGLTWTVSTIEYPGLVPPLGVTMRGIARVDASTAVAAAGGGFQRTTDAGESWTFVEGVSTSTTTNDVDFVGALGFATAPYCGNPSCILRSVDAGQTWSEVYGEPGQPIVVDVVSSTCIVVVGDNFMRSLDGGDTWTTLPFDFSPTSISFIDELHGAVVAGDRVYVTADGGVSWAERVFDPVYAGATAGGWDVEMLDQNTLYVAAQNTHQEPGTGTWLVTGQFLRSTDGGFSWQSDFGERAFRSLARNQNGVVLLAGDAGIICRWTAQDGIEQVTGSHYPVTYDGGRSAFVDSNHGVVIASRRYSPGSLLGDIPTMVLRTDDGGESWSPTLLAGTHLTDVAVTASGLYAAGSRMINDAPNSVILKSLDGGQTWSSLWSASLGTPRAELVTIAFGSASHGVAIGKRGLVLLIDNDVVTPAPPNDLFLMWDVQDVAMSGPAIAMAVSTTDTGSKAAYRSTDGGATWTYIETPFPNSNNPLYAVTFASPQVCVAGGARMFRSEDGGATWTQATVQPLAAVEIRAIAFASDSHGLAVGGGGARGIFLETVDGGLTWNTAHIVARPFGGVACFEPFRAVISGPELQILEYPGGGPVPTLISSFEARGDRFAADLRWSIHDGSTPARFEITRRFGDVMGRVATDLPAITRTYRDESVVPGGRYEYTLLVFDEDGSMTSSAPVAVTIPSAALELLPNRPNPFNPATTIRFVLPERGRVRLSIYDVGGRHVATLLNEVRDAGPHSVQWNGTDAGGGLVASGVYLGRLESGKSSVTRKMLLLK